MFVFNLFLVKFKLSILLLDGKYAYLYDDPENVFISLCDDSLQSIKHFYYKQNSLYGLDKFMGKCFMKACEKNRLDIVKWIVGLNHYNVNTFNGLLHAECKGCKDVTNYLKEILNERIKHGDKNHDCIIYLDSYNCVVKVCDYKHYYCSSCFLDFNMTQCLICNNKINGDNLYIITS